MRLKGLYISLIVVLSTGFSISQRDTLYDNPDNPDEEMLHYKQFLEVVESSLKLYYDEANSTDFRTDSIIDSFGYEEEQVPLFHDSVYCNRLAKMNEMSPFHLDCNQAVLSTIDYFARKRRTFTGVAIGRSALYFNMFEEKLAKHGMPIELKYLSVIESGLRPQIKSHAGALGLWQFMYRTGKMYGLEENSYIDERMDPDLATEAACRYLKHLYDLYNDWNMALAAYNAGPGNVNKAIRRSGGKMTYWEIRPFLPRETQGYVPNFIAMSYMMTYYAEHNIRPRTPVISDFETDTVCLRQGIHMNVIDSLTGWKVEDIQLLNPIFKTTYIPSHEKHKCLRIPLYYVDKWIEMEDSLYALDSLIYQVLPGVEEQKAEEPQREEAFKHHVRSGESLSVIAEKYGTSVSNIMNWNNLRSTRLKVGQRLLIYGSAPPEKSNAQNDKKIGKTESSGKGTVYTVRSGDSLWKIANRFSTTISELEKLNPGINSNDLKIGQKIRVN
ncbi:MAG: LysM peptidoglycan-binding domain-containing protein [Brumimicrobium sp.]|nr:LysM peptidoglycan-binding domain-containing protein [Brumimicrobium sp.]